MRSRKLNKRVAIWETNGTSVADGYGGSTLVPALLSSSWANVKTFQPGSRNNASTDFGILDADNAIIVTVRKRKDLVYNLETMYLVYRSERYIINTTPTNIDFEDRYIQFICSKQSIKSTNNLT